MSAWSAAACDPVRNDVPGGGPRQLFFFDPDGARVEINIPVTDPEEVS